MVKATQVYRRLVPHATLSDGWYQRFMARHSQLTNRVAQVISHARNNVDEAGIERLHQSLTDVIAEHGITAERVFNMDDTSFASRRKSKDVVALKGSPNVWAKTITTNFHLSIVACGTTGDLHTISKPTALRIASTAWLTHMLPKNIVSGFETAGIFPVSLDNMMQRFNLFKGGGSPESYVHATWLVHQEAIRTEVLCLPGKGKKRVGRKTIDVGGRILTLSLLSEIDATVEERKAATKRKLALQGKRAKKRKKSQKGKHPSGIGLVSTNLVDGADSDSSGNDEQPGDGVVEPFLLVDSVVV
ncbi:hypothetical protein DYB34_008421 [Aphanomyces astaci]|uniref:HTH CENPB-type domain-containing protein n=1 Tax=Aphanomyces astaci TaxID=112090 RepID=A0A3R6VKD5_APHAT|nr:hypothetical protein DYB34_008421 [Aphanomyces astaci]